ncbi:MAG: hypothetical protein HGB04_06600 [Chlorobiaceae bacterium]|nr:hypothetical protein [Chlorobiaceae bacterium]
MTLPEIKDAVESGKRVCWSSDAYAVARDSIGQWLIKCRVNGSCIGLTWLDGKTLNGDQEDFYVEVQENQQ